MVLIKPELDYPESLHPLNDTGASIYNTQGLFMNTLLAMALSSGAVLCYTVFVVMGLKPWWEAQVGDGERGHFIIRDSGLSVIQINWALE